MSINAGLFGELNTTRSACIPAWLFDVRGQSWKEKQIVKRLLRIFWQCCVSDNYQEIHGSLLCPPWPTSFSNVAKSNLCFLSFFKVLTLLFFCFYLYNLIVIHTLEKFTDGASCIGLMYLDDPVLNCYFT